MEQAEPYYGLVKLEAEKAERAYSNLGMRIWTTKEKLASKLNELNGTTKAPSGSQKQPNQVNIVYQSLLNDIGIIQLNVLIFSVH